MFVCKNCKSVDKFELMFAPNYKGAKNYKQEYNKNNDIIKEQQDKINWLEFQRKQLEETAVSLKKPKGVLCGLIIFAIVSVFCIIFPLILCPFSTPDYYCYIITKTVVLSVFVLGLISIFGYLTWLLSWKQDNK